MDNNKQEQEYLEQFKNDKFGFVYDKLNRKMGQDIHEYIENLYIAELVNKHMDMWFVDAEQDFDNLCKLIKVFKNSLNCDLPLELIVSQIALVMEEYFTMSIDLNDPKQLKAVLLETSNTLNNLQDNIVKLLANVGE